MNQLIRNLKSWIYTLKQEGLIYFIRRRGVKAPFAKVIDHLGKTPSMLCRLFSFNLIAGYPTYSSFVVITALFFSGLRAMANVKGFEKILCINLDPIFCRIVSFFLEDCGFSVYATNNIQEALKYNDRVKPDLVISDLTAKTEEGLEVTQILLKEHPCVPVVVLVEESDTTQSTQAIKMGAWNTLFKPIKNMAILEHVVCRALEHRRLMLENESQEKAILARQVEIAEKISQLQDNKDTGKSVQHLLLPKRECCFDPYTLSHQLIPSVDLSGDYLDYFSIDENHLGFYIADVSGHGACAGFVTVYLKSLMENLLQNYRRAINQHLLEPHLVLSHLNEEMANLNIGHFLTIIYCVLNRKSNTMAYSIGGHYPNPILSNGKEVSFLKGRGYAVGAYSKASFETQCVTLPETFSFALLTDGAIKQLKTDEFNHKEEALLSLFNKNIASVESLTSFLRKDQYANLEDDITLLLMNRDHQQQKHI